MQNHQNHSEDSFNPGNRLSRPSTNNDPNLLTNSLKRLSINAAANTPLPTSPSANSPRRFTEQQRLPSSPGIPPSPLRRSPSTASLNRSSSPALGRKSSTSSLRNMDAATPRRPVSRRSSFNPNQSSPVLNKAALPAQMEEKPPLKPSDVAAQYFEKELATLHYNEEASLNAGTIVIIHDQCYGHRFSRPKTSKSTLSLIVERPERILAGVLGISAAYVRLGERHAEGRHAPHPDLNPTDNVPFTIRKTSRQVSVTSPAVTNVHGTKWMEELKAMCENAERKLATTGKELSREGPSPPGQPAKEKFHEGDLYLCAESLNAFQGALGGVLDAVDAVFKATMTGGGPSRAFVCVRPPGHHCSADFPSGFCWLNNVHVGIEHASMVHGLTHAAIIDFDLHHGDGSQAITWAHNKKVAKMSKNTAASKKTSIGYFSLHDINSYPCEWGEDDKVQNASLCIENAHGQSVWNIHLQPWKTEAEFWELYESRYIVLIEKARAYLKQHTSRLRTSSTQVRPKAAIFLSAGFDASEHEGEGMQRHKVNVPTEFYARFTRDVVRMAQEQGTGVDGRVISVLEGGYRDRALTSGILSHISGLCDGQSATTLTTVAAENGLSYEMSQRMGSLNLKEEDMPLPTTESTYDPQWWHESRLAELESIMNPMPVAPPKKQRTGAAPTYSSPTQSFTAKVVDPSKLHRSVSGRLISANPSRAPTPPPPDVDWATAAHELSKLLIPRDRQTKSCRPEELSEVKVKKEKTVVPPPAPAVPDPSGRQLRGRRAAPAYAEPDSDDDRLPVRTVSRSSRRKTMADFPLASTEAAPVRPVSRRMSVASSIGSVTGDRSTSRASGTIAPRKSATPAPGAASNGVQVKKARAGESAKARPPVPRIPSGHIKPAPQNKENDMDQLTTGLKRITLKLPPKEEYEKREAAKKEAAAAKTTAKKAAVRTTKAATSKSTTTTNKKAVGRPSKVSKPSSPVEAVGPSSASIATIPHEEAPSMQQAAAEVPLVQPQPVQGTQLPAAFPSIEPERRVSSHPIDPPTEPTEISIEPDQLPKSHFMTVAEPLRMAISPPRPDTPPPPPPSIASQFVNYDSQSFGNVPPHPVHPSMAPISQAALQWMAPNSEATFSSRPMSPNSKQQNQLPVFSANGPIPFAAKAAGAPSTSAAPSAVTSEPRQGTEVRQVVQASGGDTVSSEARKQDENDIWEVPETPGR